ncbi:hypothetical protein [Pseudomonas sp. NPDC007930]|uniref:HVO_A0114 family putative DNA-binding protein n=1 Tax=Pseudomonas sp. NPDC007930 TaxID=3364417 RepID=UPI0036E36E22
MKTVTLGVGSLADTLAAASAAFQGEAQGQAILFETPELLFSTLTPNRWALLRAMAGQGGMAIRAAARLVGKDVKNVHADVQALISAGILRRTGHQIEFPFDAIHVEFTLCRAAA